MTTKPSYKQFVNKLEQSSYNDYKEKLEELSELKQQLIELDDKRAYHLVEYQRYNRQHKETRNKIMEKI